MRSFCEIIIQQPATANEVFWCLTATGWTAVYTAFTILGTCLVGLGAFFAFLGIQKAQATNKENNEIQKERILQERLIELSHEWNSKDFIEARNRAAVLMDDFKGKETSMYPTLVGSKRLDDWIMVSMIAHFFERLSYIQSSRQIYRKNAILEFKEAIEYWHFPLTLAYSYDEKTEERIRKALTDLKYEYQKPESDIP